MNNDLQTPLKVISNNIVHVTYKKSDYIMYSVSQQKTPLQFSDIFFSNNWEFVINFLHTYYTLLSTLNNNFFIQLSPTLTKLCHTKRDHPSIFSHYTRT